MTEDISDLVARLRDWPKYGQDTYAIIERLKAETTEAADALARLSSELEAVKAERDDALKEQEEACQEAWQEGYDEGKSEWRDTKAQLWNAIVHWLELRHGARMDADGYTVNDLLDGLAEVEAENKRAREMLTKIGARAEAAEARNRELEAALKPILDLEVADAELLRIRNRCEGTDKDVKIWPRMLQIIVDAVRSSRAALNQGAPDAQG